MFKPFYTFGKFFRPKRLVFHRNPLEGYHSHEQSEATEKMKKKEGIPINAEVAHKSQERTVDPELKEVRERLRGRDYAQAASFEQDPRKKEDFRFLPLKHKMEYLAYMKVSKAQAESFLDRLVINQSGIGIPAREYIATARLRHMESYNAAPAYDKVPKVTPGLRTPELAVDTKIFAIGGSMMEGIAGRFPGKPSVLPGSGNPSGGLKAFESLVAEKSADELKGATVLVAFDREMFTSGSFDQYMKDTETLLKLVKEKEMVAVVSDPLNIGDLQGNKENWKAYRNLLATLYQKGYIKSLIGMANATTDRSMKGVHEQFMQGGTFTAAFHQLASNGFVAGVNLAHGKRTLDEELLPVERAVNADTEVYYYGSGRKAEGTGATTELLPAFPSIADIPDETVKRSLWHLGTMMAAIEMGAVSYTVKEAETHMHQTKAEIDRAEKEGIDMTLAKLEYKRVISEIYYMYAWTALQRLKGRRPGGATREQVITAIEYAEKMNLTYGFHPRFTEQVKKLREALSQA